MKYIYKFIFVSLLLIISTLLYISNPSSEWFYKFYVVSSDSMRPNLNRGDLVVEKVVTDLSVGDIVTFRSPSNQNEFITHRIVKETSDEEFFFTTKGDNNSAEDPWQVTPGMIVGELKFSIPILGYPILFLKSSLIYSFILGGFLILFSFVEINLLSSEINYVWERKNSYRMYRYAKRYINSIDNFMARFQTNRIEKIEDAG